MNALNLLVTPIWSTALSDDERWNIDTTVNSSPSTEHRFVAPVGLDTSYYGRWFPDSRVERFPDTHFRGIARYSRFMLNHTFYERFADHTFITLVQTDAVLVRDLHEELSLARFDYVGPPWEVPFQVSLPALLEPHMMHHLQFRSLLARTLTVGNGGLSVRRTAPLTALLRRLRPLRGVVRLNEDLVIAYLGALGMLDVAPVEVARRLFYERDSQLDPLQARVHGFHALARYYPEHHIALRAQRSSARTT